jgi:hypothetical protein
VTLLPPHTQFIAGASRSPQNRTNSIQTETTARCTNHTRMPGGGFSMAPTQPIFSKAPLPAATPAPACQAVASKWPPRRWPQNGPNFHSTGHRTPHPGVASPPHVSPGGTGNAAFSAASPKADLSNKTARPFKKNLCQAPAPFGQSHFSSSQRRTIADATIAVFAFSSQSDKDDA